MGKRHETPEQRFNQLYGETRDDVLAYLTRRSRTLEDATDALAETYTAAWQKLDKLPDGNGARLWLFGAARNELRMAERRNQSTNHLTIELANHLRTTSGTPTHADNTRLHAALGELSRIDYEILTLTAWEELAPREIATVLNLSANVVRIRLSRARSHLHRRLQHPEPSLSDPTAPLTRETQT